LEDHPENYTRFLLLTPSTDLSDKADKLSLVMKLPHRPGALYNALEPFARGAADALAELRERATEVRLLGCYPSAQSPGPAT
jgi:prephenate dehydratase